MKDKEWWKKAVVYQIYPKSFRDADGDGSGDIKGITERLDYLKWLGADVLWICPVYCSPMDDNGYDISDYYHIDPSFGTDEDMDELIREAGKRRMKILMDLVVNHTSDEHEWFRKALEDTDGKYAGYYIFREGRNGEAPDNLRSYFGGSAWEPVGDGSRYYFHAFGKKQPDLNWENKELREEIIKMMNYWLDKGLGGFRVDAIGNLKKNLNTSYYQPDGEDGLAYAGNYILNQPGIETYLADMRDRAFKPHNSMTVAEVSVSDEELEEFIGKDGFFSMVFDFSYADIDIPKTGEWFLDTGWTPADLRENIFHSQLETQKRGWGALYLENHDQPRSVNKYLPSEDINDCSKKMLATLYVMLRGTPFIYQGQEIGMTNIEMDSLSDFDDIATADQYKRALEYGKTEDEAWSAVSKRSRDNSRTPMQWDDRKNAGFSDADKVWLKVNPNFDVINVSAQSQDETSVLQYYRKLVKLRKEGRYADILTEGEFRPYEAEGDTICYIREKDGRGLLVLNNFGKRQERVKAEKRYCRVVCCSYGDREEGEILVNSGTERRHAADTTEYVLRPYESLVLAKD